MGKYESLFQPLVVRRMFINNRTVMTPMGTNYGESSGQMSPLHINYYEMRAAGGCGLIIVENACVKFPEGSNGTTQLRIDNDTFMPRLYQLCEKVHTHGTKIAVQLNHAGASAMEARIGMQPVSASNLPNKKGGAAPRPLTVEEIYSIADDYATCAKRAQAIGFDAIEIHAGHSYLISQFFSPLTNDRTDEFGGSLENRARFCKIVMEKCRAAVGPFFPIIMRVSADEFLEGGNTLEDTLQMLDYCAAEADIIDVSAGLSDSIHKQIDANYYPDGWRSYMARAVKEKYNGEKFVITMGNIRDPKIANELIEKGDTDLIGMGRQWIADPEWAVKAKYGREDEIRKCISCNVGCAGHRIGLNRPIRCTVNPVVNTGDTHKSMHVNKPTNVVVIGGGTAGMEAACTAAEVGCTTFLIEKTGELGGLSGQISKFPAKYRVRYFTDWLINRASKLHNLIIFKNQEPTMEFISSLKPDLIVNTTGSTPLLPPIKGLRDCIDKDDNKVTSIAKLMNNLDKFPKDAKGLKIAVVGGGAVGLDVVEYFSNEGAEPTIIEMAPKIGNGLDPVTASQCKEMMEVHNVNQMTRSALREVTPEKFIVEVDGEMVDVPFDYGFVALGMRANAPLIDALNETFASQGIDVLNLGDSQRARRIIEGVQEGRFNVINNLKLHGRL